MERSAKQKKKAATARLVIVVIVFLMVTLIAAGLWWWRNTNKSLKDGTVSSVTVSLVEDGENSAGDETWEVEDREELQLLKSVMENGISLEEKPRGNKEYRRFSLTFHKLNTDVCYDLYLCDDPYSCYFTDEAGILYLISTEEAGKLLAIPQFTGLAVSYAAPPVCSIVVQEKKTPTGSYSGTWTYTKANGEAVTLSPAENGPRSAVLPMGEELAFDFTLTPDFLRVRIQDEKENLVYSGDFQEMKKLSFDDDTRLTVTVVAQWLEREGRSYQGELNYEFDVLYDVPAACVLSVSEARPGESVEVRILHSEACEAEDPTAAVTVVPTFTAGDITWRREGKVLVFRIPVASDVKPREYEIEVGGVDLRPPVTLTVTILNPEA